MKYFPIILISLLLCTGISLAQDDSKDFDIDLLIDYSSAEQTILLYQDQFISNETIAELRGNRIVAATTGMIAAQGATGYQLQNYLDSLKYRNYMQDDVYQLEDAKEHVAAIKDLLDAIKKRNFNRRVIATVEQIFPHDVDVSSRIPLYLVAFGHENVDAFVRRIAWHDDVPQFTGEHEGELTIVVNLAHAIKYSNNVESQFVQLLGVVAHEVFHAVFGLYKDESPTWKLYYATHHRAFDELMDLTQNEGIAYYLSLDQQLGDYLPRDWNTRMEEVFQNFNENSKELLSEHTSMDRADELIREANLSGFWDSYGAMAGMYIARAIDKKIGRAALKETISNGPIDFFRKYINLTEHDPSLPKLKKEVARQVK